MKTLPNKHDLDMMWTVATSGSLETGTRPHYGFAEMLYDYFTDTPPHHDKDYYKGETSTDQEA